MASFIYRHPMLYNFMLKLIHRKTLNNRYRHISKIIGKNKKVFELGCGTALLRGFLDRGCSYTGWDLNPKFVEYCRKRGINAKKMDIFDFDSYPKSDVIIICDVLHHIFPRDGILLKNAMTKTKNLIIVEPYLEKQMMPNFIMKRIEVLDDDGINNDETRYEWNPKKCDDVINIFRGKASVTTERFGLDMIAIFESAASS